MMMTPKKEMVQYGIRARQPLPRILVKQAQLKALPTRFQGSCFFVLGTCADARAPRKYHLCPSL